MKSWQPDVRITEFSAGSNERRRGEEEKIIDGSSGLKEIRQLFFVIIWKLWLGLNRGINGHYCRNPEDELTAVVGVWLTELSMQVVQLETLCGSRKLGSVKMWANLKSIGTYVRIERMLYGLRCKPAQEEVI